MTIFLSACQCNVQHKKQTTCYTSGTFDMFHVGHLRLLEKAKPFCDKIIVGIHPDETIYSNKKKYPIINLEQRMEIVKNIKFVDSVVPDEDYKFSKKHINKFKVDIFFIGDDYYGRWDDVEAELVKNGSKIMYFPYTTSQSSSKIRKSLSQSK